MIASDRGRDVKISWLYIAVDRLESRIRVGAMAITSYRTEYILQVLDGAL